MNRFPLVKLPRRVMYVDDDGGFLNALRRTMPRVPRKFCDSPATALDTIRAEAPYWRSIERLLANAMEASDTQGGEASHYVTQYFQDWRRFHLTSVLVVDYNMPGMNGLELVRELGDCPTRRVLLTGVADAEVAVGAFNKGLIQKFIPKSTPNLNREITASADEMHRSVCEHLGHLIRSTVSAAHIELLHEPKVATMLAALVEDDLGWSEYVVVGQPFGLLGMSHDGPLQWLQLETQESLREQADALADLGYASTALSAVSDGTALSVHEIETQLGLPLRRGVVDTDCLGSDLYYANVDLPVKVTNAAAYGVDDILSLDEMVASLLRDVVIAHRATQGLGIADAELALGQALAALGAAATASQYHGQALHAAVARSAVDQALAAKIEIAIAQARRGNTNGAAR